MRMRAVAWTALWAVGLTGGARGQAKIQINDDASLTAGFLLQTFALHNDAALVPPQNEDEVRVRRARLRLQLDVTPHVSGNLQTDFANDNLRDPNQTGLTGGDMRVIDAYATVKPNDAFQFLLGEHVAAASRQNATAAGNPMTWDRPLQNNKTLTWGTRSVGALQTRTLNNTSAGLKGDVDVRDLGATWFGFHKISDLLSAKHYLGAYQGSDQAYEDDKRFTGRVQVNVFDAEPKYFNNATYYGGKKTVALGASYDGQQKAAKEIESGNGVDYEWYTLDAFGDLPLGPGSLTLESAYNELDLGGAGLLAARGSEDPLSKTAAKQAEGSGYYVQAGYFIPKIGDLPGGWQPWVLFDSWDAGLPAGSYEAVRVGLTYVWKGHNANLKLAYERLSPEESSQPEVDTVGLGLYLLY